MRSTATRYARPMIDLLSPGWPAPENVTAGTTLRTGGVSTGPFESLNLAAHVGDSETAVAKNRTRFASAAELPAEPHWLQQVHGTTIVDAAVSTGSAPPIADGSTTTRSGTVCLVMTADCLPVLLSTRQGDAVGAAHAGWRGLAAGVLEAAVAALGVDPDQVIAWLGPAIGPSAYEVGNEVRAAFVTRNSALSACFERNERGRWQADLYALARARLTDCGVADVYGGDSCTALDQERFFSYRRDGECGRMATFIYRR